MSQLTDTDRALLSIHARSWRFAGALELAVFEATGLRLVASWQRVNVLIDSEAALVFAPVLVNRLRRVRAARLRTRVA